MTLHIEEVGVRELHDHTSQYVQQVAAGSEVVVTLRGRPVARMSPIRERDAFEDLRRRGLVREPISSWNPTKRNRPRPRGSVSEIVSEQRS